MSDHPSPALRSPLPFADNINIVGTDQPFRWLAAGWRDFRAARLVSAGHGLIFVAAGLLLTLGLVALDLIYLIAPLTVGFLLVGPALTVGFYAISRDLESSLPPTLSAARSAWRRNPAPLMSLGLMQVLFLVIWMRFAAMIFAVSFPSTTLNLQALLNAALFTPDGLIFLAVGTTVGAVMATLAFAFGAFSLPLLLDRRIGVLEAIVTSAVAVILNARAMLVWAGLVALFTGAGLAAGYIGLTITLPLIGHATWHAYRAIIRHPA
jgi:uncharacterized membrane protein